MSYRTPEAWHTARCTLIALLDGLEDSGGTILDRYYATAAREELRSTFDEVTALASAVYSPGETVALQLNRYQLDNLTAFLAAVKARPEDKIGQWDTGDWWSEMLYKCQTVGGDQDKGNSGPLGGA